MPWFRWLKKAIGEEAAQAAPALPAPIAPAEEPDTVVEEDKQDPTAEGGVAPRKRRRRGSRGGKARKKPGEEGTAASDDANEEEDEKREKAAGRPQRRSGQGGQGGQSGQGGQPGRSTSRRRQQPKRQPLPSAKRELVISVDVGEQRVAVLEDDAVAEVYLERPERRSIAGNIYLGTVDNVLPGMEAAFVEIGLEKNGFLYVDEIVVPELEGKARQGKKITDLIQRGQTLLVQAVKDPMKTKGARLTTEISLPGRFLVFVPQGEGLGVSRRLEDGERQRLKDILKEIAPKDGGVIVRTAAEGASAEDIERDLVFLQRLWKTIQTRANAAKAPELVYQEAELPLRIVRDLFAGDFAAAYVDNDRAYKRIAGYLKKTSPHMLERVHRYKEKAPLFEHYGIEREIASTLSRRVDLPSGGYLIFDYAEAFTVIDVNTGRFVGSRSRNTTQRLEDTIVKNNLEAVKEVVRQLRLRDIGGIIVIDFIDMANQKNRLAVEEALRLELERDRTKTYVVEISPLGLVEMTRQNVTDGPREVMTRRCPTCEGDGIVVSDATMALVLERKLRALGGAASRTQPAYRIAVHPRMVTLLAGPGGERLAAVEEAAKRRFLLEPAAGHVHNDHFEVLAEGKLADLRPEGPVAEDSVVSVKLVEIALHDATAGSGKHQGIDVVVAGAAKQVGKTVKVKVGRVVGDIAFGTLVGEVVAPAAITFESEAEKPTRAPARRKAAGTEAAGPDADVDDVDVEGLADVDEVGEGEGEGEAVEVAVDGSTAPAKKRTRRGSRGGKRRKKPAGADGAPGEDLGEDVESDGAGPEGAVAPPVTRGAESPSEGAEAAPAPRPRQRRTPKIHVPDASGEAATAADASPTAVSAPLAEVEAGSPVADGEASAAPRKRTRRGSRGGRGRSRPRATANGQGTEQGVDGPASGDGRDLVDAHSPADAPEPAAPSKTVSPPKPRPARRRAPAAAPAAAGNPAPAEPAGDGYVPMSEWIEDFDRR
ncbi:MAG: Rne/Rng family ribonuclease [Gaiella sp.]